jgi:hypothetical protein
MDVLYMDQTLPGVESVSCFWPGYILPRKCIFPMSVEKPISVSVPQNGNFSDATGRFPWCSCYPARKFPLKTLQEMPHAGREPAPFVIPVLYYTSELQILLVVSGEKKNICIYIFQRFLLIKLWTETAGSWGCVPAKDKRMFIFLEVFRRIHYIHTT